MRQRVSIVTTIGLLLLAAGCSTGAGKPDEPPAGASGSVDLPPGTYHRIDGEDEDTTICDVPKEGRIRCRGKKPSGDGLYTLGGIPVGGADHFAPAGRPSTSLSTLPDDTPTVVATRSALRVDGETVASLDDLPRGDEAESLAIPPLVDRLDEVADSGERDGVVIVADRALPYDVITRIVFSAGRAKFSRFDFAVVRSEHHVSLDCRSAEQTSDEEGKTTSLWSCRARPASSNSSGTGPRFVSVGTITIEPPKLSVDAEDLEGFCAKKDIRRVISEAREKFRSCWEAALRRRKDSSDAQTTKLLVQWKILLDGTTGAANVVRSTGADDDMNKCMLDVVRQLEFPEPKGGICLINYPFHFHTKTEAEGDETPPQSTDNE